MKQIEDSATPDMIGGIKKKPGRKKLYANTAERSAAYRARKGTKGILVQLEPDLHLELHAYMARINADSEPMTISEVISKLLRTQLLRKR